MDSSTYAQIVLGDNISWVFAGSTINLWRYNWQTNKWEPASQNFDTGDNLGATGTIDDAGNVLNVWFSYNAGLGVRTVSVTSKFWALANSKSLRGFSVTSDSPSVTGFWVKHYPKDPKTGKLIGGQLLPGLDCGGNFS